jgi:hypothetical protein
MKVTIEPTVIPDEDVVNCAYIQSRNCKCIIPCILCFYR